MLPTLSSPGARAQWARAAGVLGLVLLVLLVARQSSQPAAGQQTLRLNRKIINAATWNIAAINNNPFEYWITSNDSNYLELMTGVSAFVDHPTKLQDVKVSEVFTESMAQELFSLMTAANLPGVNATARLWREEYAGRATISQFLKDGLLGKKRLTSMPDRVTNTINTADGSVAYRPAVINCYEGDLGSTEAWWAAWRKFFFSTHLSLKKSGATTQVLPLHLLTPIAKAKYPSITQEEAAVSLPLQTLCLAIFDAILVNMMNTLGSLTWQPIRGTLCRQLNHRKTARTLDILEQSYSDMDALFLQEVAANFRQVAQTRRLARLYDIHQPAALDQDRDQNSFVLLRKGRFGEVREVTADVAKHLNASAKVPVARGDLLALLAVDRLDSSQYLFASFHGDTNGLATKAVVGAVHAYAVTQQPKSKLLFGLDANTYADPEPDQQGVADFARFFAAKRLDSCYGPHPDPHNFTTFNARTHLQPQLNKAVAYADKDRKGDKNPKDFILFFAADYAVQHVAKDNTGARHYVEDMVFPTLDFPSDHGITSTVLQEVVGRGL